MSSNPFMARALSLAERGRFSTSPNPRVGCVVVDARGDVVGEGFHEHAGGPHAEAVALAAAGERARGGTVYVNLEPCAHRGRTPPCTEALVAAGVARVVASIEDPDPRTSGAGFSRLSQAGVAVSVGEGADLAARLNEVFLVSSREKRPFVHLKWAASLDGKTSAAGGAARWITGGEARQDAMRLREECDAVLVGAGTVLADDPLLTRRLLLNTSIVPHRRIVLDGRVSAPSTARVFDTSAAETWLVTARAEDDVCLDPFRARGVRVLTAPAADGRVDLAALTSALFALEVRSVLVEGGGLTAWTFLEASLADRVTSYVAPKLLGGPGATPLAGPGFPDPNAAPYLRDVEVDCLGADLKITGRVG